MPERKEAREVLASLEEHHSQSFGWALSCCGWRIHLAEDVLQASYLKVLEGKAGGFPGWTGGSPRGGGRGI